MFVNEGIIQYIPNYKYSGCKYKIHQAGIKGYIITINQRDTRGILKLKIMMAVLLKLHNIISIPVLWKQN
jgi:hypothetical protein